MSETQQNQNRPHLLLTMAMIVLETIFTFILKHDRVVSLQAKNLLMKTLLLKSIVIYRILIFMFNLPSKVSYLIPKSLITQSTLISAPHLWI